MWLRGILADEHGEARESVTWITGGLHNAELTDRVAGDPPAGMTVRRASESLDSLLRRGEIDAIISPTSPSSHSDPTVPVDRMWPNFAATQADWWRRRRIFPIMHVLVVRRECIQSDAMLGAALCGAFDRALALACQDLLQRDFPKITLATQYAAAQEADALFGADLWTTGLEGNRQVLEMALANARADGLTTEAIGVDDLFSV
jgi:4,5-dihydroxyphthalate decarboxylase